MCRTNVVGTGGDKPPIHPVITEITLLGDGFILVKRNGIVGACFDAGLTSGTQIVIHDNNAVFSFGDGRLRAGPGARRIVAVPAHTYMKVKVQVTVEEPGAIFLNRNKFDTICGPVFLFAGHFTGFTTPA